VTVGGGGCAQRRLGRDPRRGREERRTRWGREGRTKDTGGVEECPLVPII
jgi:hypothetical protein